ncbi:ATP-dependent DNA helicase sgs1 [Ceratobasidium sp. 428]|nr:ATP-dependent DNA helicase sgs1 [Ceratobasidium sp. 428]
MALFVQPKMVVWMISPLNYIEEEQARTFRKWGISAVAVNSTTKFDSVKDDILAGRYQVVILSPENFCRSNKLRLIVVSDELQSWFHATVINEAHCVHTWGKQFRVAYDRCGDMHGYMPPESPFLAATATCMEEIEKKLRARLFIREHPHVENLGNFRENIEYGVYVMVGGLKSSYKEICKFIPTRGVLRRTIIFVDSIKDAYHILAVLQDHLGLEDGDMELVQPYHAL